MTSTTFQNTNGLDKDGQSLGPGPVRLEPPPSSTPHHSGSPASSSCASPRRRSWRSRAPTGCWERPRVFGIKTGTRLAPARCCCRTPSMPTSGSSESSWARPTTCGNRPVWLCGQIFGPQDHFYAPGRPWTSWRVAVLGRARLSAAGLLDDAGARQPIPLSPAQEAVAAALRDCSRLLGETAPHDRRGGRAPSSPKSCLGTNRGPLAELAAAIRATMRAEPVLLGC